MTFSINKHRNDLLFVPLGGAGEIGMNVNLYYCQGKWLMADLGAGFADDYLPGVDMIVADISFIVEHKEDLLGIVLTHAHEDHLGAVQYLWDELRCPIYTTPFTAAFLRAKISEMSFARKVKIHEMKTGSRFDIGPFNVEMVGLTHSAPEMQALMIRTPLGNILHTGDWKFDPDPLVGPTSDVDTLKACGDEGVLALIGDSTNVFTPGTSGSEGALRESLISLVSSCDRLVAVTTFASNVARIETIARAAQAVGRKIILAGRSLWRIVEAARQVGYLTDIEFLEESAFSRYSREQLLVMCTGCQGEPLAATSKIANGSHHSIRFAPGDTVIFSSKIIPGNEKRIFRLFNQFVHMQVEVMTEKDHFVHVSGHPSRDELKRMYELVRPKTAIPVHGERVHIHEHVRLAKEWGVPEAVQVEDGDVIRLSPGTPEKIGQVQAGYLAIDGYYLLSAQSGVMRTRRKIQRDGVICVTLLIESTGDLRDPIIMAPGSLDPLEDRELLLAMADDIRESVEQHLDSVKGKLRTESIEQVVRSAVRRVMKRDVGKNPVIMVHIERI